VSLMPSLELPHIRCINGLALLADDSRHDEIVVTRVIISLLVPR
jgi:hypothetical protein